MKLFGLAFLLIIGAAGQASPDRWKSTETAIKRLPPSAFPQLPARISNHLKRRGCTIPQSAYREEHHNVIRGEFMVRGQKDWAVLCSRKGVSVILVLREGLTHPLAEVALAEDQAYIQGGVGGRPEYSRSISTATKRDILSYRQAFGGGLPPRLDHHGIDDSFDGRASVVRYFYKGRWLELTGMD